MNSSRLAVAAHRVEIDEALDQVLERIDVERVEIVGRPVARQRAEPRQPASSAAARTRTAARSRRAAAPAALPPKLAARQKSASRCRASSGPPRASPSASITAFTAPAEAPEMPSMASRPSASSWSSTPQVKAPCAPPPCRARLTRLLAWANPSRRARRGAGAPPRAPKGPCSTGQEASHQLGCEDQKLKQLRNIATLGAAYIALQYEFVATHHCSECGTKRLRFPRWPGPEQRT